METSAEGLLPHELKIGAQAYRKDAFGMGTLADRLNHIIKEQGISKADFARLLGISENYVYISSLGTAAPTAGCSLLLQS